MKTLIPILSRKEDDPAFLEAALAETNDVIVLVTIDGNALVGKFGFVASELSAGSKMMERISGILRKKKIKTDECVEWGDTATKISQLAQVKKVDKIAFVGQNNQYFDRLMEKLRDEVGKKIRLQTVVLEETEKKRGKR